MLQYILTLIGVDTGDPEVVPWKRKRILIQWIMTKGYTNGLLVLILVLVKAKC